jgi:hypothetical protein
MTLVLIEENIIPLKAGMNDDDYECVSYSCYA